MALETIKIAELPSATQVVEDDYLVVEQPDKTKKATVSQVISDLDLANKGDLSAPGGASLIGTSDGTDVQQSLDTARANERELWRRALHDLGLTLVEGSFEDGATLTYATDAIWHIAGAQCYTWGGTFPKTVPAESSPSTTGGVSASAWVTVGGLSILDEVTEIKNEAVEAKDQAEDARDEAQAYALQASELGNLYASISEGLAATTDGQYFQVPQGSGSSVAFKVYKNNAGVAQEVAAVPGTGAIINTIREYESLTAAQNDVVAGNIAEGSHCWVINTSDSSLADEYINTSGTLVLTGRSSASVAGIEDLRVEVMSLLNSVFRTSGLPDDYDLLFLNKLGQYNSGIQADGTWNFASLIAALASIKAANIQSLSAGNLKLPSGAEVVDLAPTGFDWAVLNKLMKITVGIKSDGALAAGKLEALYADIGKFVAEVVFNGGAKTASNLPEGFSWAIMDPAGRTVFGSKDDGSVEAGTIKVKKLIATDIESDSLPVQKEDLKYRLADMIHIIIYGQSLSTGINAQPLQTTTAVENAYRYGAGVRAQDGSGTSAQNHATIVPYTETTAVTGDGTGYETPMGGAVTAVLDRLAVNANSYTPGDVKILGSAPGQGSRSISELKQPTGTYMTRVKDDIYYGLARANENGWTYSPHAMIWMQGETDQSAGTTAATYKQSFSEMVDTINTYASGLLGKQIEMPWFIYQFNSWINRTPNTSYPTIPMALLDLARTRADTRLVQPMYMYDYADNAHLLGFDSKICGYRFGIAIEQELITGKKFEPLWSKDHALQGGIANIWYDPVGKLALDTSIVSNPGNYGISAIDPDGNPLTITEVSVHLDRLRVRASTGIPAGSKIRLGFIGGTTGQLPSRTTGPRCCLRDSQGDNIKFDPNGIAYRMDNYAIVEEITLN